MTEGATPERVRFADFDAVREGDRAEIERVVTEADVRAFAVLSGDDNPLHLDPGFAGRSQLGGVVAHGMLGASYLSAVIGTALPGPGALWLSQHLNFRRPVRIGDRLRIAVWVKHKSDAQRVLILGTDVRNQRDECVIDGDGTVQVLAETAREDVMEQRKPAVALVTGASRGIGAAIARQLAAAGCRVAVNFLKEEGRAKEVLDGIRAGGGDGMLCRADVSREDDVRSMVAEVTASLGPVDVLVSNAGGSVVPQAFETTSWSDVQRDIDVHVRGAFNCMHAVLPAMVGRRSGRIVVIGSMWADGTPPSQRVGYVIAKHALVGLCRTVAVEYGPHGISANVVAPGVTETDLNAAFTEKARALTRMQTPLRRLGAPADVAGVVTFLATTPDAFISGATIRVCGGQVML